DLVPEIDIVLVQGLSQRVDGAGLLRRDIRGGEQAADDQTDGQREKDRGHSDDVVFDSRSQNISLLSENESGTRAAASAADSGPARREAGQRSTTWRRRKG